VSPTIALAVNKYNQTIKQSNNQTINLETNKHNLTRFVKFGKATQEWIEFRGRILYNISVDRKEVLEPI